MLMVITDVNHARDTYTSIYCHNFISRFDDNKVYQNPREYLHDPKRFGLNPEFGKWDFSTVEKIQKNWERVRRWNRKHKTINVSILYNGYASVTRGSAYLSYEGVPEINIEEFGTVDLRDVELVSV